MNVSLFEESLQYMPQSVTHINASDRLTQSHLSKFQQLKVLEIWGVYFDLVIENFPHLE